MPTVEQRITACRDDQRAQEQRVLHAVDCEYQAEGDYRTAVQAGDECAARRALMARDRARSDEESARDVIDADQVEIDRLLDTIPRPREGQ